jgi:urease accessory protein
VNSTLLLLADGRFPAGGHAHSGGLEEAVDGGRVRDASDLQAFLLGRLATVGKVDAAVAAAGWATAEDVGALAVLDAEAGARCPSPALRAASRAQGRGLLRAATAIWPLEGRDRRGRASQPSPGALALGPHGPMYPVALGMVGRHAGLPMAEVALVAAQASASGPAWAATRLLGLDPFAVGRCLAAMAGAVDAVAAGAVAATLGGAPLPAYSAPLTEIGAERHARWEVRLFAS